MVVTALQFAGQGSCEGDVLVGVGVRFPVAFEVNERQYGFRGVHACGRILRFDNATSAQAKSTRARDGPIFFSVDEQNTGGRAVFGRHSDNHVDADRHDSSGHPVHARCRNGEDGRLVSKSCPPSAC